MIRGVGLRGAISVNIITMIGIGPLITIPLVVGALHGGLAIAGWVIGAIIALCDGLVWAELSSRYPGSGGTYVYLREAFGRKSWGRLFAFLFNWQFFFCAPLLLASGYIGFAQYASYLFPQLGANLGLQHLVAAALAIVVLVLLYRRVTTVTLIATALAITALITLITVIAAGAPHIHAAAFSSPKPPNASAFMLALGTALVITLYDYAGYNSAALIGDEIVAPVRTIPRSIVLSIAIIAALYILLQVSVLSVVPWPQIVASKSQFVAASAIENVWGAASARVVTVLILITAFASTYGVLLGFSRIPYAAALDDEFFPVFGRLHPRGRFPYVSLLVIGLLAIPACFFTLDAVISFLIAGIVLIQSIAQIAALLIFRRREGAAPFSMWLFPIPAIVALLAWLFIFYSSGKSAMLYGTLTLLAGVIAYLITARVQRRWPFLVTVALVALCCTAGRPANAASFGSSAIVQRNGYPIFTVDGKPFFIYGAAFFYERIPRGLWRQSLVAYKALGINTIDLYVIWNWHELHDGDFDFTGRTNPRRDLRGLLQLIHRFGFHTIIRPGPVIRNEWRNGGYPAWLLERPEYNMPLHDVLEGRYPATATLQNAHSDQAAAEWMSNSTHLRYADRWLRRALMEVAPWGRDVLAIALDDDQGAYLNNQTWPAANFQAYLHHLAGTVRSVAGTSIPLFINTYQMKVTASAPVWAWGNWYQSEAYHLGEHDRRELEFSTALLATQPHLPVMQSEFQAGWLQGPDQAHPRRVAPENTALALHTLLQSGTRGIVNFPVQDTVYPSGWEVPFANASYAWDAALTLDGRHNARYRPTMEFGQLISKYGRLLAQTHRVADAAIAYTVSAYDPLQLNDVRLDQAVTATRDALTDCRTLRLSCDLVDLRYAKDRDLEPYRYLVVPLVNALPLQAAISAKLKRLAPRVHIVSSVVEVHPAKRAVNIANAVLSVSSGKEPFGFLDIVNYDLRPRSTGPIRMQLTPAKQVRLPSVRLAGASGLLIPINLRPSDVAQKIAARPSGPPTQRPCLQPAALLFAGICWRLPPIRSTAAAPSVPIARRVDVTQDGEPWILLANPTATLGIAPLAGARAFVFQNGQSDAFTSTGALRDDVDPAPTPSARDYISTYTHQFPAGTFNRAYDCRILKDGAQTACMYFAPDLGTHFERAITMQPKSPAFTLRLRMTSSDPKKRGVLLSALSISSALSQFVSGAISRYTAGATTPVMDGAFGFYDPTTRKVATVCWPPQEPLQVNVDEKPDAAIVRVVYPPDTWQSITFGYYAVADLTQARSVVQELKGRACVDANGR